MESRKEPADIVRAAPDLAPALSRIALAGKRHWGYPESWIEIWAPDLTLASGYVAENPTFAAAAPASGEAVGFYALAGTGGAARLLLDHLWVRPDWIGCGLGRLLFTHAAGQAAILGAESLGIEAEPHAEGFYLHMGARRVGEKAGQIAGEPRVLPLLELDLAAHGGGDGRAGAVGGAQAESAAGPGAGMADVAGPQGATGPAGPARATGGAR